jgi:hypothetical protein
LKWLTETFGRERINIVECIIDSAEHLHILEWLYDLDSDSFGDVNFSVLPLNFKTFKWLIGRGIEIDGEALLNHVNPNTVDMILEFIETNHPLNAQRRKKKINDDEEEYSN